MTENDKSAALPVPAATPEVAALEKLRDVDFGGGES